ncbi:hypothetical protein FG386_001546 [Cryptosporidium ryanae]|uniref:uncharacterized protein n=1 Tax=Cryptosporidium ryanae TaxID=515981 RepID=UPI00351A0A51|nr:hypothetical protein FG386_001546 [Cryptosporidium ryanae]
MSNNIKYNKLSILLLFCHFINIVITVKSEIENKIYIKSSNIFEEKNDYSANAKYDSSSDGNLNFTNIRLEDHNNVSDKNIDIYKVTEGNDVLDKLTHSELIDSVINSTISQIQIFKLALTLNNDTEYKILENKFNDTYLKYKEDVMLVLNKFDLDKNKLFDNINIETQKKLYTLIMGNSTLSEKKNRKNYDNIENTPINYINGLDLNIWNEILDFFASMSISLLNNNKSIRTDKAGIYGYLNRKNIIDISKQLGDMLLFAFKTTEKSNCGQIAWSLVYENWNIVINNYNLMVKKQIKNYQSSTLMLLNKNSGRIKDYNLIISKFSSLELNIRGLLDLLVNARSNNLNSLVTVEDVYNDIKSLKEYSIELNKKHNEWVENNISLMKPLVSWFETTITLLYKIWLDFLKSVLSAKIRNIGDILKTLRDDLGGDILKMEARFDSSLSYIELSINSLNNKLISLRNDINSEMFLNALKKLRKHYKYLKVEYKKIIGEVVKIIVNDFKTKSDGSSSRMSIYDCYDSFLSHINENLSLLWNPDLLNPFRFDKKSESHLSIINNLFKNLSLYLNSEVINIFSNLNDNINKLRYFNNMLFIEFIFQMDILNSEFNKFQVTGRYNKEVLNILSNRAYINNYIQKCNIYIKDKYKSEFNTENIYNNNNIYKKSSMWEFEKILILNINEFKNINTDYVLNNKASSLLANYYDYRENLESKETKGEIDVMEFNNHYLDEMRKVKDKLIILRSKMEDKIRSEYSTIDSLFKEINIKNKNKLDEHINEISKMLENLPNIDKVKVENIISRSKKILDEYGYNISDRYVNYDRRIDKSSQNSTISKYKIELERFKKSINKYSSIIKKITSYNFDVKVLKEHIDMIERYLDHLEGQINLYCNRINKDNDKISRSLYILKYIVKKKRPDTQCERLILDFSSSKSDTLNLIKISNDIVNEFISNINLCKEIQDTTKNYKEIIYGYQSVKESINNLKKITSSKSFNEGTYIIDRDMKKLSQRSKLISKELLCYFSSLSDTDITVFTENIKRTIFKLQNTIEKEIKDSLYN